MLAPFTAAGSGVPASLPATQLFKHVSGLYLSAARASTHVDADLQTGLGVLYYTHHDLSRAVDCFQAGVAARPDDARLWNRLGATLANSGQSMCKHHPANHMRACACVYR